MVKTLRRTPRTHAGAIGVIPDHIARDQEVLPGHSGRYMASLDGTNM